MGPDVKGGGAVHPGLGIRPPAVLLGHTLGKVDGHLGVDQAPVLPPSGPLFRNIHHGQIQHFQQAVIGGKDGLGLGHLAELAVEALNGIGGIDWSDTIKPYTQGDIMKLRKGVVDGTEIHGRI